MYLTIESAHVKGTVKDNGEKTITIKRRIDLDYFIAICEDISDGIEDLIKAGIIKR